MPKFCIVYVNVYVLTDFQISRELNFAVCRLFNKISFVFLRLSIVFRESFKVIEFRGQPFPKIFSKTQIHGFFLKPRKLLNIFPLSICATVLTNFSHFSEIFKFFGQYFFNKHFLPHFSLKNIISSERSSQTTLLH